MTVKIRLQRVGKKDQALYRLVVANQRSKSDGKPIAFLGSINKDAKPPKVQFNKEKLDYWLSVGAKISDSVRKLLSL